MARRFLDADFLLHSETARRLYHEVAADLPIIDYHSHLPQADVATNRRFDTLYDIWLDGDHYKWRAMRSNGIDEQLITGDADPYDKFLAWSRTVPHTLRNPLYHWTHLELQRTFGITDLLNEESAPAIWEAANARLADDDRSARGILDAFKVEVSCTTDDPADDLAHHQAIADDPDCTTKVLPTFRPDALFKIADPCAFNAYVDRLAAAADTEIGSWDALQTALRSRHDFFHAVGGRLSDHGLPHAYARFASEREVADIFAKARGGESVTADEAEIFGTALMVFSGKLDAEKGWTKQLHLGPMRNNRTTLFESFGPDAGTDSIGDARQAEPLSRYLDALDRDGALPKTVLYNLNPADNYVMGTMIGNFQDGSMAGKIQFGSGWWFLDQKEGMTLQINALSNLGLLSHFVGMLTDSRSFLSFPRHEYFRRILCNMVGSDVENGELPSDPGLIDTLIRNVCYDNARRFFGFYE